MPHVGDVGEGRGKALRKTVGDSKKMDTLLRSARHVIKTYKVYKRNE